MLSYTAARQLALAKSKGCRGPPVHSTGLNIEGQMLQVIIQIIPEGKSYLFRETVNFCEKRRSTSVFSLSFSPVLGVPAFVQKVTSTYFKLNPHEVIRSTDPAFIRTTFRPHNPTPSAMKAITVGSLELLRDLRALRVNTDRLRLREGLMLARLEHYLRHFFGKPYTNNYFSGKIGNDIYRNRNTVSAECIF